MTAKFSSEHVKVFDLLHGVGTCMGLFGEVTDDIEDIAPDLKEKVEAVLNSIKSLYQDCEKLKEDWTEGNEWLDCKLLEHRAAALEVNCIAFRTLSNYDNYPNTLVFEAHPELEEMEYRFSTSTANHFWYCESQLGLAGPYQRLEEKYPRTEEDPE